MSSNHPIHIDDIINGTGGDDSLTGTSGSDTLNGKGGVDTLNGGAGDDVMNITDLNGDHLIGGAGYDIVNVTKAVDVDFGSSATLLSGIEELDLGNSADTLVLAKGMDKGAQGDVLNINTNGGADSVDASTLGSLHVDINLGSGADTLTLGAKSLVGDTYEGGSGNDTIDIVNGGNVDLTKANIDGFEQVNVDGHATTLTLNYEYMSVNAGTSAGTVIIAGEYGDSITLGAAGQTVEDESGDSTIHTTIADLYNGVRASTILGDGGTTLAITGGGDFNPDNFTLDGVNNLVFNNAHYNIDLSGTGDSYFNITLGNGDDNLITGSGYYNITGGRDGQTVDMSNAYDGYFISNGNGVDNVTGGYSDNFGAILGGGNDTYTLTGPDLPVSAVHTDTVETFTIDAILNGGAGFDTLVISTVVNADITMSSSIVGFEEVDLSGSNGHINLTTNNQVFDITGNNDGDTFNLNNAGQSVHAGSGDDTVNLDNNTVGSSFVYDGGAGYDTLNLYVAGADTLGAGVTNLEEIDVGSEDGPIVLTLTGQGGDTSSTGTLDVDLEGGGNSLYAGSGSGLYVTLDEGNNFVNLQNVSNTEVFAYDYSNDVVKMGTGTGIDIELEGDNDTVQISSQSQIGAYDAVPDYNTLDASGSNDTLEFTAAGTYDLTAALGVSGFRDIVIDNGNVVNLTLDNHSYIVAMGDQAGTSVTGGSGNDTFDFGANGQSAAGGLGDDTYVVTGSEIGHETITELAGGGNDTLEITGGGTFTLTAAANNNIENFVLDAASNVTDGLTTTSDPAGYTLLGSGGNDTITITTAQLFSGVDIDGGGHAGGGSDVLQLSGAGTFDFTAAGVTITAIGTVDTGTGASNLVLNDSGYLVNIDGNVHTMTSGAGDDTFNFTGVGNYNGVEDVINNFTVGATPGPGHDVLDLAAFHLLGYDGSVATDGQAIADLTSHHMHAVFSAQSDTLFVDTNGDGVSDLSIQLSGVGTLTPGSDLII